ncbi:MAG: hypothetical protein NC180_05320 [Muribaculaceae bacterium]|nr:hypothetical protein [Roseburia sp.]MCM1430264.1 hypothetical protein [Muribaculaceae bacterium]MCM1492627.1 hypothetical protein [Muribaculaceae bacterium]
MEDIIQKLARGEQLSEENKNPDAFYYTKINKETGEMVLNALSSQKVTQSDQKVIRLHK